MPIIEMEVHMDCSSCERKIHQALSNLEGVQTIDIDIRQQKVTVSGCAAQMTVLETVRNTGNRAELWSYPYSSDYHPYVTHYFQQSNTYASTCNYERDGHMNGTVQDCYQSDELAASSSSSILMDDRATTIFSDENPHACSLM